MKSWCQEFADAFYEKLLDGILDISEIVDELKSKWNEDNFRNVNFAASEVATCLMRKEKVIWGDRKDGEFKKWNLEGWEADEKIEKEMKQLDHFAAGTEVCSFKYYTGEQGV